ncbi:MAG: hypothetical protein AB7G13_24320 [Lautropia sp.]
MTTGEPARPRRSRALRNEHLRLGAVFAPAPADEAVLHYDRPELEPGHIADLALVDLTFAPRWGIKGPDAPIALRATGLECPPASNRCVSSPGGATVAALSATEYIAVWDRAVPDSREPELRRALTGTAQECYFVDHFEGMFCFAITGARREQLYRGCCAVDLSDRASPAGHVVQTRLHHTGVVILRRATGTLALDLILGDISMATYTWHNLSACLAEAGGSIAGIGALHGHPSGY